MSRSLIGRLIRSQPSLLVSRNAPLTEDEIASYTTAHHQPAQLVQSRALHGEPDFLHDMSDGGLLKRPRHLPLDPLVPFSSTLPSPGPVLSSVSRRRTTRRSVAESKPEKENARCRALPPEESGIGSRGSGSVSCGGSRGSEA